MLLTSNDITQSFQNVFNDCRRELALLDRHLTCLWASRTAPIKAGCSLAELLIGSFPEKIEKQTPFPCFVNKEHICALISPLQDIYLCEFFNADHAVAIYEMTDCFTDNFALYTAMEFCLGQLWRSEEKFKKLLPAGRYDVMDALMEYHNALFKLTSLESNLFEYTNMLNSPAAPIIFDISKLCTDVTQRCNMTLAKCSRSINVLTQPGEYVFVSADGRHATLALVNALQNAMLYSPYYTEPTLTVYPERKNGIRYAVIRIRNERMIFRQDDFSSEYPDFRHQRTGMGMRIIRRFAEQSGGTLDIDTDSDRFTLYLRLPAIDDDLLEFNRLEDIRTNHFKTTVPELIELKMQEVVDIFKL